LLWLSELPIGMPTAENLLPYKRGRCGFFATTLALESLSGGPDPRRRIGGLTNTSVLNDDDCGSRGPGIGTGGSKTVVRKSSACAAAWLVVGGALLPEPGTGSGGSKTVVRKSSARTAACLLGLVGGLLLPEPSTDSRSAWVESLPLVSAASESYSYLGSVPTLSLLAYTPVSGTCLMFACLPTCLSRLGPRSASPDRDDSKRALTRIDFSMSNAVDFYPSAACFVCRVSFLRMI
jgi:hypothetical protein